MFRFIPWSVFLLVSHLAGALYAQEENPQAKRPRTWLQSTSPQFRVAISPTGVRIATSDRQKVIRIWDLTVKKVIAQYDAPRSVTDLFFTSDSVLLSGHTDNRLRKWDLTKKTKESTDWGVLPAGQGGGFVFASGMEDNSLLMGSHGWIAWDVKSNSAIQKYQVNGRPLRATSVIYSKATNLLYAAGEGVREIDVGTGKLSRTLASYPERYSHVALRSDGRKLVASSAFGLVKEWDLENGVGKTMKFPSFRRQSKLDHATPSSNAAGLT